MTSREFEILPRDTQVKLFEAAKEKAASRANG